MNSEEPQPRAAGVSPGGPAGVREAGKREARRRGCAEESQRCWPVTWEGWRERLPAIWKHARAGLKAEPCCLQPWVEASVRAGETGLLVSLGHWGSQHGWSGGLASPDLPSTVASWKGPWALSSVLLEGCYRVRREGFGAETSGDVNSIHLVLGNFSLWPGCTKAR